MISGVDGVSSYRSMYAAGTASTRESTGTSGTEETEGTGQVWDAVFTDDSDNGVSVDDFLNLMVAQLQNQDFMNPVDDTQYVTQLAQFATMQQMQELATYMKTNYVMSLVGKEVTAARFSLQQIMELGASEDETETSNISMDQLMSMLDREVTVRIEAEGEDEEDSTVTGIVERVSTENGKYRVQIDGKWYSADDVVEIAGETQPEEPEEPEEGSGEGSGETQTV